MARPTVVLIGTLDTKSEEFNFIRRKIQETSSTQVLLMDVTTLADSNDMISNMDISSKDVVAAAGSDFREFQEKKIKKTDAFKIMAHGASVLLQNMLKKGEVHGVMGLGGSCGTTIVSEAMQSLPLGLPKLIVSTIAAGDMRPYVGLVDTTIMHSVTDLAGLNIVSEQILCNAAVAISAMALHYFESVSSVCKREKSLVALTMFGVTTPCVTSAKNRLKELGYDVVIFHATGTGGRAMEKLIESGIVEGVLDITTTELADEFVGGILSAGPHRLEKAGEKAIPQIVSLGALDMVNFGEINTVPDKFKGRNLFEHNEKVTLMRTNKEECKALGEVLANKLNKAKGPVTLFIPKGGISILSKVDGPFYDREADEVLFQSIKSHLHSNVSIVEMNVDINDESFAKAMANALHEDLTRANKNKPETTTIALSNKQPVQYKTKPKNRSEALARLNETINNGDLIIGAGAGIGLSAKCIEEGGVDLLIIYNSGRYRMAGRGSSAGLLSYGDANAIVLEMANEILPVVKRTPVLAGVCGTDPFKIMSYFLKQIKEIGFAGVQNFPTVGLMDGSFRQSLEETGMSYDLEVDMIRQAHELGLLTAPYVFNVDDTRKMVRAGADILVAHMGVTTKGSVGASTSVSLDDCIIRIQEMHDEAVKINPNVIVLCHGGPLAEPDDVAYVLNKTKGVNGFFGASSMERLPTEKALKENAQNFKRIKISSSRQ
ncbi:unnamed protein product [Didymodactylos carnosus]|uniref:Tm-1 protein n=1 Tax=Didymodactylos carnosus TaxID=1234261 RepID=A0A814E0T3_9BILA|nr:unnamed protein product [Didymodactylos carnosus]CAF3737090.1 unnamed protein product [Didymodactylos carnosus]